jgi:imidazole glycerol-phosphate synthase
MAKVYLLDYVAGNVRSLVNAIEKVGYSVEWVRSPGDVEKADVSSIGSCCIHILFNPLL